MQAQHLGIGLGNDPLLTLEQVGRPCSRAAFRGADVPHQEVRQPVVGHITHTCDVVMASLEFDLPCRIRTDRATRERIQQDVMHAGQRPIEVRTSGDDDVVVPVTIRVSHFRHETDRILGFARIGGQDGLRCAVVDDDPPDLIRPVDEVPPIDRSELRNTVTIQIIQPGNVSSELVQA
ncbi:hypothetical protein NHL50_19685 [Acidimicrobiia bacterium EGI L10123]|uniref:hypothetical protein n=1 Tax=Salinilacustrithrix flava TaxID=2957203 RepID=UPI003D7C26E3|nr:hypothetical protein [Acidimicrobiia bacterium EGI L10123]